MARPPGLLPGFEREVSVETRSASSQAQMTSELHYQRFLTQDTGVDGAQTTAPCSSQACDFSVVRALQGRVTLPFTPVHLLTPLYLSLPSVPPSLSLSSPLLDSGPFFHLQDSSPIPTRNWSINFTTLSHPLRLPSLPAPAWLPFLPLSSRLHSLTSSCLPHIRQGRRRRKSGAADRLASHRNHQPA